MAILSTSKLHLHYGDIPILSNINLDINKRSRIVLVGANGTGKTSLVKEISLDKDESIFSSDLIEDLSLIHI